MKRPEEIEIMTLEEIELAIEANDRLTWRVTLGMVISLAGVIGVALWILGGG